MTTDTVELLERLTRYRDRNFAKYLSPVGYQLLTDAIDALTPQGTDPILADPPYVDRAERYSGKSAAEHRRAEAQGTDTIEGWIIERIEGEGYGPARVVVDGRKYHPTRPEFWSDGEQERHRVTPLFASSPPSTDEGVRIAVEQAWQEVRERLNNLHLEGVITYGELKIGVNNAALIRDAALSPSGIQEGGG